MSLIANFAWIALPALAGCAVLSQVSSQGAGAHSGATAERAKYVAILAGVLAPNAEFEGADSASASIDSAGLITLSSPAVSPPLHASPRVDPRKQGVSLTFAPEYFDYKRTYRFQNLSGEARSINFLLPRTCQLHTISSAGYYLADTNTRLKYEVVSESPGWQVVRAEVPPAKDFSVRMEVTGILWNGKISNSPSSIPNDIVPPEINETQMSWYQAKNPYVHALGKQYTDFFDSNGMNSLGTDFNAAFTKAFAFMASKLQYKADSASDDNIPKGSGNCNSLNTALATIFDRESSGEYLGVEANGIIMTGNGGVDIHAMSLVGKKDWTWLVPTDAVKFNDGSLDPHLLSGYSSMGPMLIMQLGLGDPSVDARGGVTFRRPENGRIMRAPNPGGMMWAFDAKGDRLAYIPGTMLSFERKPITDFVALRRELKLIASANP